MKTGVEECRNYLQSKLMLRTEYDESMLTDISVRISDGRLVVSFGAIMSCQTDVKRHASAL
jgi:hypothetical protein